MFKLTESNKLASALSSLTYEIEIALGMPLDQGKEVKDVPGFCNLFMVSEDGDLLSKRTNRILSQTLNNSTGYFGHCTKVGGRSGQNLLIKTHRAVALAFIPNPENKPEVNHLNGNKIVNNKNNLEWATRSENTQHAYDNDLMPSRNGFNNPGAVLKPGQPSEIKTLAKIMSERKIAQSLNVSRGVISRIIKEESYIDCS